MSNRRRTNSGRASGGGFTLTELLVSIAAIALLTSGIGRIFSSVGRLVSVGSAVSEIDQVARALERQLRDDFEGFNRMQPDETFLVIRMREIGDLNRNGKLDSGAGEITLYLNQRDRDADRRDLSNMLILDPYDPDGGRAVTRRVDEIMFIADSGSDGYSSYQLDPDTALGDSLAMRARISYGHGLRPIPDDDWPPADPTNPLAPSGPNRSFIADGDFGSSPNPSNPSVISPSINRFLDDGATIVTGRNEFASTWILGREPMLLYGGDAAGYQTSGIGAALPRIGLRREFAPYLRDLENEQRIDAMDNQLRTERDLFDDGFQLEDRSNYRRIRDGRVDICAQDHLDVRRWIEGADPLNVNATGRPFSAGRLLNIISADAMDPETVNDPLWIRQGAGANREAVNRAAAQRAIAGMFNRLQMEPVPPIIVRAPKRNIDSRQPEDALMDIHATLATSCSNFEIAWGDGSTATQDIEINGVVVVKRGETLWYDIRPLNNDGLEPIRSTYRNWSALKDSGFIDLRSSDPDLWNASEISTGGTADEGDTNFLNSARLDDLNRLATTMVGSAGAVPTAPIGPVYSALLTGGANLPDDETLVIFPFRKPAGAGWSEEAWDKKILVRVRVTLHDSLDRLPEGKKFEFIFSLDPRGN
jgi:prepilin-type N-terminal cleavage/methylation domain-containing protein